MSLILKLAAAPALMLIVIGICLAIPPSRPMALGHIAERFEQVDWSALPAADTVMARDGTALAYRRYGDGGRIVLALHGSGGSGTALHPLALALSREHTVIVPDIRGHGATGTRGDMAYIGQAADDLDDLMAAVAPGQQVTVVGFSMGGGLALKYAAARPAQIGQVLLLSPYLAHDAPPMAAENPFAPANAWAAPSVPRIIALGLLNAVGITGLNHLETVALATRAEDADAVVRAYTYRALTSVNPASWQADIAAIADRLTVIVGAEDELHYAPAYGEALAGTPARFVTLPGLDHMGLTLEPAALDAVSAHLANAT